MKGEKIMKKELFDYEMSLINEVSHNKFSFKTILNQKTEILQKPN